MVKIEDMSYNEKFDMYMGCHKADLARMLIEANNQIDEFAELLIDGTPLDEDKKQWANDIINEREKDA